MTSEAPGFGLMADGSFVLKQGHHIWLVRLSPCSRLWAFVKGTLGSHGRRRAGISSDRHHCSGQSGRWCLQLRAIPSLAVEARQDDASLDVKGVAVTACWQTAYLAGEVDQIPQGFAQERLPGEGERSGAITQEEDKVKCHNGKGDTLVVRAICAASLGQFEII